MTKREKLEKLDSAILDKMLEWIDSDETNRLPELGNAIQYLKANEQVAEKEKKTANDRHREMVEEAKRKRKNDTK